MPKTRIIGDIHGDMATYLHLASDADYSIQVGDLGFQYDPLLVLDGDKHKVLGGNHDNYATNEAGDFINMQTEHWLGDYGTYAFPGSIKVFFVRGGRSIDKDSRTEGFNWFPGEELTYKQMLEALEEYAVTKPSFVVSHECPSSVIETAFGQKEWDGELLKPSMTALLLQEMLELHEPELWIFGHHHQAWQEQIGNTHFACVPIAGYVDIVNKDQQ